MRVGQVFRCFVCLFPVGFANGELLFFISLLVWNSCRLEVGTNSRCIRVLHNSSILSHCWENGLGPKTTLDSVESFKFYSSLSGCLYDPRDSQGHCLWSLNIPATVQDLSLL